MDTAQASGGDNSFFANISEGLTSGVSKIGSTVLPNWVSKQVTGQTIDKLENVTYDQNKAPPRLDPNLSTTAQAGELVKRSPIPVMLLIGAGIIGTIILIKVAKR